MLRKRKLLRRVVLDECHLSFTASDYRPKLQQLGHLQVLRCPMILLTTTLPPVRVDELREAMHISDFRLIRISTVRANIRYMARRCPNKSVLKLVKEMARLQCLEYGITVHRGVLFMQRFDVIFDSIPYENKQRDNQGQYSSTPYIPTTSNARNIRYIPTMSTVDPISTIPRNI
jgi:hypothetical protein